MKSNLKVASMAQAAIDARSFLKANFLDTDIDENSGQLCEFFRSPNLEEKSKVGCPCYAFPYTSGHESSGKKYVVYVKTYGRKNTMRVKLIAVENCSLKEIPAGSSFEFSGGNWYYDGISIAARTDK